MSSGNEYANEQYVSHPLDVSSAGIWYISLPNQSTQDISVNGNHVVYQEPNDSKQEVTLIIQPNTSVDQINFDDRAVNLHQSHHVEASQSFENEILADELGLEPRLIETDNQTETKSIAVDQITPITEQNENEKLILMHLSNGLDQVIETIHVGDELFEAKKTVITGIQAPSKELQSSNNITSISIVHKAEEPFEILSSQIIDYINIPSTKTSSEDQIPEAIIVTTEEILSINSSECFPAANAQTESMETTSGILLQYKL
jgi:hypothetical protein